MAADNTAGGGQTGCAKASARPPDDPVFAAVAAVVAHIPLAGSSYKVTMRSNAVDPVALAALNGRCGKRRAARTASLRCGDIAGIDVTVMAHLGRPGETQQPIADTTMEGVWSGGCGVYSGRMADSNDYSKATLDELQELALEAQLRLERTPYHLLGPAGKILVDNPPSYATPQRRRERFRVIVGGAGDP